MLAVCNAAPWPQVGALPRGRRQAQRQGPGQLAGCGAGQRRAHPAGGPGVLAGCAADLSRVGMGFAAAVLAPVLAAAPAQRVVCTYLTPPPPPARQAVKEGVRLTLAMGEQPRTATVQGQQVLQAQLALPTGARRPRFCLAAAAGEWCSQPVPPPSPPRCPALPQPLPTLPAARCASRPPFADPRERGGLYWGYTTRIAPSIQAMLQGCPFPGGYDLTLGTSGAGRWCGRLLGACGARGQAAFS